MQVVLRLLFQGIISFICIGCIFSGSNLISNEYKYFQNDLDNHKYFDLINRLHDYYDSSVLCADMILVSNPPAEDVKLINEILWYNHDILPYIENGLYNSDINIRRGCFKCISLMPDSKHKYNILLNYLKYMKSSGCRNNEDQYSKQKRDILFPIEIFQAMIGCRIQINNSKDVIIVLDKYIAEYNYEVHEKIMPKYLISRNRIININLSQSDIINVKSPHNSNNTLGIMNTEYFRSNEMSFERNQLLLNYKNMVIERVKFLLESKDDNIYNILGEILYLGSKNDSYLFSIVNTEIVNAIENNSINNISKLMMIYHYMPISISKSDLLVDLSRTVLSIRASAIDISIKDIDRLIQSISDELNITLNWYDYNYVEDYNTFRNKTHSLNQLLSKKIDNYLKIRKYLKESELLVYSRYILYYSKNNKMKALNSFNNVLLLIIMASNYPSMSTAENTELSQSEILQKTDPVIDDEKDSEIENH